MTKPMYVWEYILIHHSATKDHPEMMSFDNILQYHIKENIWQDIGYQFLAERIEDNPVVIVGRGLDQAGAHCAGMNTKAIGVCFVGNYEEDEVDVPLLKVVIHRVLVPLCKIFKIPPNHIEPHRHRAQTFCPGKKMLDFMPEIVKEVAKNI